MSGFCHSLGQGEVILLAALKFIEEHQGHAFTLAPETVDSTRLATPRYGGVIETRSAREGMAPVLEKLAKHGATCVVVEDELSLKRDPKPSLDGLLLTAFVGEQVIHWARLEGGPEMRSLRCITGHTAIR